MEKTKHSWRHHVLAAIAALQKPEEQCECEPVPAPSVECPLRRLLFWRSRNPELQPPDVPTVRKKDDNAARVSRIAVFAAHGMGQQVPFSTMDVLTRKLREEDGSQDCDLSVRSVEFEDEDWLRRVEFTLLSGNQKVDCHVYEGYWAPLTEGRISVRQVVAFLFGAARNGLKNGRKSFVRWMFGSYQRFSPLGRMVLYLLVAVVGLGALIAMNTVIVLVSAASTFLGKPDDWLSSALKTDLTTTFNFVLAAAFLVVAFLFIAKKFPGKVTGSLSVALFVVFYFVATLGSVAMFTMIYGHVKLTPEGFVNRRWLDRDLIRNFDEIMQGIVLLLVAAVAVFWVGSRLVMLVGLVKRDFKGRPGPTSVQERIEGRSTSSVLLAGLIVLALAAVGLTVKILLEIAAGASLRKAFLPGEGNLLQDFVNSTPDAFFWFLLVGASAAVRRVLIQYVGDVAIYISPYKLDEFNELREEIKKKLTKAARNVYSLQDEDGRPYYDKVFVVGHSLGSVIAYDVLNELIRSDQAAEKGSDFAELSGLGVAQRTPLLLTFGSPLDKTAFLFAVQYDCRERGPREALASAGQPLIQSYDCRPERWMNVYSPWDIISGSLNLYDVDLIDDKPLNPRDEAKKVCNIKDPKATTLFAAHVEYWKNDLIYEILHQEIRRVVTGACKPC
ncbi:MAG TPA: hypothetical protein VFV09_07620 [Actinomycetota bacterium]|nr:hypothetical protein [Actinomycetota bacterium]